MIILLSLTLYRTRDSRVFSFCSAFRGDRTVTRTCSKKGITKLESNCIGRAELAKSYTNHKSRSETLQT